jgi:hypothetical protein
MTKPVLQNAEGLTGSIMQQIENKSFRPESRWIVWVRAVSSAAAVFLLGWYVCQQTEAKNIVSDNPQAHIVETSINPDHLENPKSLNDQTNLLEAYLCYMQQHSTANNRLKKISEIFKS